MSNLVEAVLAAYLQVKRWDGLSGSHEERDSDRPRGGMLLPIGLGLLRISDA